MKITVSDRISYSLLYGGAEIFPTIMGHWDVLANTKK
jgi:hypothetical protein